MVWKMQALNLVQDKGSLIQKQTEMYGWEFIFLGANIDALEVARDYGFKASRAANFHSDKEGTALKL